MQLAMGVFCLIIILQLIVSSLVLDQINEISDLKSQIQNIEVKTMEIRNNNLNYFHQESQNSDYFITGRSEYLWKTKRLNKEVKDELAVIMANERIASMDLIRYVKQARVAFYKYQTYFHEIEVRQLAKGYVNSGLEGKMNDRMNKLMQSGRAPLVELLQIRNNEKEFILRADPSFSDSALAQANLLSARLAKQGQRYESQLLGDYSTFLEKYVEHSREIGFNNTSGLRNALYREAARLDKELLKLSVKFDKRYVEDLFLLDLILFGSTALIIIVTILLSITISRTLSKPILRLVAKIKGTFDGEGRSIKLPKSTSREIVELDKEFTSLVAQVESHVDEIQQKRGELEKQNQELTALTKELDYFIYHTSHDLRAPLTSISGLINVAENAKDGNLKEYFHHMKSCLEQLDSTIIEIIHFYKNRSEEISFNRVDLTISLSEVLMNLNSDGVEVDIDIQQNLNLVSDRFRLDLILNSLLANAIRYRDDRKETCLVKVKARRIQKVVEITVEDNGIGIAEEQMQHIFEMFYRASDKSTGSGLGLYIAQQSIEKLEGKLEVESKIDHGTKFTITLPVMELGDRKEELTGAVQN